MYSFYPLINYQLDTIENSMKVIENINTRDVYESVIMRCISYNSEVILSEVLKNEKLEYFKELLKIDNKLKMNLIDCAIKESNVNIVKMVFEIYKIEYIDEFDELIKNGDLVYTNNQLINKKKDFDYIVEYFEDLTGEPLLVYDECVCAMEKYMNEKLSDENKQRLKVIVSRIQEQMYNVRQEMAEMDNQMYEAWYDWITNVNYNSYYIEDQNEIWNEFKEYYETIELESESEYEKQREEDYDY
jgi:hypothetical protein